jgi:hypothetical protein
MGFLFILKEYTHGQTTANKFNIMRVCTGDKYGQATHFQAIKELRFYDSQHAEGRI